METENDFFVKLSAFIQDALDESEVEVVGISFKRRKVFFRSEAGEGEIEFERLASTETSENNLCPEDDSEPLDGEHHSTFNRLVVSPAAGLYQPLKSVAVGTYVKSGQIIGRVGDTEVVSVFSGFVQGTIAQTGERLKAAQPVIWLRSKHANGMEPDEDLDDQME